MTTPGRTLRWGIRDSFISYIERTGPHRIDGARADTDGSFLFDELSDDGGGTVAFRGAIDITAHGGLLRLVLTDPVLRAFDDGLGLLDVTRGGSGTPFTLLALTRRGPNTWSAALTSDGSTVFDHVYPEGAAMSDVIIDDTPSG